MKKLIAICFLLINFEVFPQDNNLVVTKHQLKVGGEVINYTAAAGYMMMKDENDSLKAKVFFVAYTKDGETDISKRPVLFAYNGGP